MLRSEPIVFLAIWLLSLVLFREAGFNDPGTFWHTRVGQLILDQHSFPRTDSFTFTFAGQPWIPQQWLAEVGMALIERAAGWDGLLLALATLLAGLHTALFSRLRLAGVPVILALFFAVAAWFAEAFHDLIRPHMATLAFTAWTAVVLVDFDRGRRSVKGLSILIPGFILWTNLHGGVLGGMMMLGFCAAWWFAAFAWKRESPVRSLSSVGLVVAIGIGCGLTAFVNPFGIEMVQTWGRIVGSGAMKEYVVEHQPLDLSDSSGKVVLLVFGSYALLVATTVGKGFRVTWLIPFVWFALTFKGIRQGPLCIVTCLALAADVWPHSALGRRLTAASIAPRTLLVWVIPAAAVLTSFLLQVAHVRVPLIGSGWARHDAEAWPESLLPTIREIAKKVPRDTRIYNDTYYGGYLIWHAPELKIFTDDRFELTGEQWLREYVDAITHHPERFDEWQRKYGFRYALIVTGPVPSKLDDYLSARPGVWKELARQSKAVLFEKID
ncbi:MAG: hypothetical protein U0798_16345 [Gemmataceae bacterium]